MAGTYIFIHVLSLVMVRGHFHFYLLVYCLGNSGFETNGILYWSLVPSIYWTFKCRYQLTLHLHPGHHTQPSTDFTVKLISVCCGNMAESMNEQDHILYFPFLWIDFTMCVWIPCWWMRSSVYPLMVVIDGINHCS